MHRRFITTIIAAAMAVTAMNAPAQASDRLVGALAAVAGIAIVGSIIHDNQKQRNQHVSVPRHGHQAKVHQPTRKHVAPRNTRSYRAYPQHSHQRYTQQYRRAYR